MASLKDSVFALKNAYALEQRKRQLNKDQLLYMSPEKIKYVSQHISIFESSKDEDDGEGPVFDLFVEDQKLAKLWADFIRNLLKVEKEEAELCPNCGKAGERPLEDDQMQCPDCGYAWICDLKNSVEIAKPRKLDKKYLIEINKEISSKFKYRNFKSWILNHDKVIVDIYQGTRKRDMLKLRSDIQSLLDEKGITNIVTIMWDDGD